MGILGYLGRYKAIVLWITAFLVFVAVILAYNTRFASQMANDAVGIKYISREGLEPQVMASNAQALAQKLANGQAIDSALEDLRMNATSFDGTFSNLASGGTVPDGTGNWIALSQIGTPEAQAELQKATKIWSVYKAKLEPVLKFSGSPYAAEAEHQSEPAKPAMDPKAKGAAKNIEPPKAEPVDPKFSYSPRGARLASQAKELAAYATSSQPELSKIVANLTTQLERAGVNNANKMRGLQAAGLAAALALFFAILFYFVRNLRKEEVVANRARKETENILRTVNEGLFLLDRDLKVGTERSMALDTIFRREDFMDVTFDRLLKDIVPEKTLRTAMDYVALLWGERVNEKLVKTINPLNEVEVHFDNPAGGFDTHFLEFDFNRVKSEGTLSHLLVTVNDVTKRVMLSRELQESQEKAQAQLDLLLRILHVDPESLTGFLTDADVSLKMVNSILKEPAREESAFRAKIDGLYRQVHAVKGEASALGLKTVEQRAHAFEESLSDLKARVTLSGSDFLPLVVKLDDLFNHLAQVREMLSRLVDLHQAIANRGTSLGGSDQVADAGKVDAWLEGKQSETTMQTRALSAPQGEAAAGAGIETTLESLAQRVASSQSKRVGLKCAGLDNVPEVYRRAVKDIAIQLVRNAVVHGIEEPNERLRVRKPEAGALSVEFSQRSSDGYELVVQDDGRGLQLERIKEVAIERGLITPAQSALLDPRQTMALIFRPGFSTADRVTTDAGRGAGMDLVRILVAELGGRVGLASAGGRFAKFKIWLPATERAVAA
jgi:HPt (histidine-containing phosphotransfer) domain-containing protein/two-component sensor histidine kinase